MTDKQNSCLYLGVKNAIMSPEMSLTMFVYKYHAQWWNNIISCLCFNTVSSEYSLMVALTKYGSWSAGYHVN